MNKYKQEQRETALLWKATEDEIAAEIDLCVFFMSACNRKGKSLTGHAGARGGVCSMSIQMQSHSRASIQQEPSASLYGRPLVPRRREVDRVNKKGRREKERGIIDLNSAGLIV